MPIFSSRRLRLVSGVILWVYILLHMLNHMLGLLSVAAAEQGLYVAMVLWTSWPGTVALYGAAALHGALAVRTLYNRRNWSLPAVEWLRLWAGFSMPALLLGHVMTTRVAASFYDHWPTYGRVVEGLIDGGVEGKQIALLAPGWLHGCLGLWISLRRRPAIERLRPFLIALAVAMPAVSAAGFLKMRSEIMTTRPAVQQRVVDPAATARREALEGHRQFWTYAYFLLILGAAGAGMLRNAYERKSNTDQA